MARASNPPRVYVVRAGDYPVLIAQRLTGDAQRERELRAANAGALNRTGQWRGLSVGQRLALPESWPPHALAVLASAVDAGGDVPPAPVVTDPRKARAHAKALILSTVWWHRYNTAPSKHAIARVMSVAEHETNAGDAWTPPKTERVGNVTWTTRGKNKQWGAIQRRSMTKAEAAQFKAGTAPDPVDAYEELHPDSGPKSGRYVVWFYRFQDDYEGAFKLCEVLLDNRPQIKSQIDTISAEELARLMYLSRYYEGVNNPDPKPGEVVEKGQLTAGQLANISDYVRGTASHAQRYLAWLADFEVPTSKPPHTWAEGFPPGKTPVPGAGYSAEERAAMAAGGAATAIVALGALGALAYASGLL